jgi:hypothetical protein
MPRMHDGYPCTGRDMYGRWGYILWDRLCRACMMDIHVQVEICMADGDTFSDIGYAAHA